MEIALPQWRCRNFLVIFMIPCVVLGSMASSKPRTATHLVQPLDLDNLVEPLVIESLPHRDLFVFTKPHTGSWPALEVSQDIVDVSLLRAEDVEALHELAVSILPLGVVQVLVVVAVGAVGVMQWVVSTGWVLAKNRGLMAVSMLHALVAVIAKYALIASSGKNTSEQCLGDLVLALLAPAGPSFEPEKPEASPTPPQLFRPGRDQGEISKPEAVLANITSPEPATNQSTPAPPQVQAMLVTASPCFWEDLVSGQRRRLRQLPSREIEMRSLNRLLGGSSLHVVPAAEWPIDVEMALERSTPRVLVLSGHWYNGCWAAETAQRNARLVTGEEFAQVLHGHGLPELMFLNGCTSHTFGGSMMEYLKAQPRTHDLFMVCCTTKLHDDFAASFCRELCSRACSNSTSGFESLPIPEAFRAACAVFGADSNKFRMGDPSEYLHSELVSASAGAAHAPHPYNAGCTGCNPPVHGVFQLLQLHASDGQVTELACQ
eukprot:TRINITY_DN9568_c0_g1_i1.p1 TRINITY_DN9568_c0_g1~~TRINITY_DN9568_c0_g1_i1.p1  ORF type:complete len:489 (-),score=66.61 TRINITY_DN9568_c0_g1_i1:333-1799(-)